MTENQLLFGKMLMSLATVMYGFIPPIVDFNSTHATNPTWPGHARFHVVWQVLIMFFIAILSLYLIWFKVDSLVIAFFLGIIILGSFFLNTFFRKRYKGTLADKNGIQKTANLDSNFLIFIFEIIILSAGYYLTLN
jgi:hypothetical protein